MWIPCWSVEVRTADLLTSGDASDVRTVPAMLAVALSGIQCLLADKGYDASRLGAYLRTSGVRR